MEGVLTPPKLVAQVLYKRGAMLNLITTQHQKNDAELPFHIHGMFGMSGNNRAVALEPASKEMILSDGDPVVLRAEIVQALHMAEKNIRLAFAADYIG